MKRIIIFSVSVLFGLSVKAQGFAVKELNRKTVDSYLNKTVFNKEYLKYKAKAFDLSKKIAASSKKEKQDLTLRIQDALNQNRIVLLPNYTININDKGLILNTDQVLLFQPKTILKLIPTSKNGYSILRLENVSNVIIFNANIEGDKYKHLGKAGQWGFGIDIKSSDNISIFSPYIKQTWGDGIYIGQSKNKPSSNINIFNAVIDDVRRNGISITSANGVQIKDCYIANTNGNSPQSALDIEPNSIDDEVKNINISNLTTTNNKWAGILLVFEKFKSPIYKEISVNIDGHNDIGSKKGIAFHGYLNDNNTNNLNGTIKIKKVNYIKNSTKYFFYKTNLSELKINTDNLELETQFNTNKREWKR